MDNSIVNLYFFCEGGVVDGRAERRHITCSMIPYTEAFITCSATTDMPLDTRVLMPSSRGHAVHAHMYTHTVRHMNTHTRIHPCIQVKLLHTHLIKQDTSHSSTHTYIQNPLLRLNYQEYKSRCNESINIVVSHYNTTSEAVYCILWKRQPDTLSTQPIAGGFSHRRNRVNATLYTVIIIYIII